MNYYLITVYLSNSYFFAVPPAFSRSGVVRDPVFSSPPPNIAIDRTTLYDYILMVLRP